MASLPQLPLAPLPYHVNVVQHLQAHENELWAWFSAEKLRAEQVESVRLELLKSTYRLEPEAHPALHDAAREAAERLGLTAPLTLYQAQGSGGLNASLAYVPGEAHLVLHGSVTDRLTPLELRAVLGHELLHFLLLDGWSEYLVASQILSAMTHDAAAEPVHATTARRFGLYTEVYCDRGAHLVAGDLAAAVSALVKIETGIAEASAESYLRQADEIFGKGHAQTEGVTHPETFVRARALRVWAEAPERSAAELRGVIEGRISLAELDLLGQQEIASLTRRLVTALLRPAWLQTEPLLAHARLFFEDLEPSPAEDPTLAADLAEGDEKLLDYWCYVILDFAAADRDLEDAPLAAALLRSEELGLGERFRRIAAKELGLKKKQLDALEAGAAAMVAKAAAGDAQA
ncbi:M48 family metalloprotease [Anaeromyxobacter terrae]|uniref:M48 family metalloprotease n=1 Tax=Anaeromyxobacter terrae TaxID=2925406 RepID=UPI001F5968BC|nr:M48 family metalloprotease [Anaeromyxobacter sp. SG22]